MANSANPSTVVNDFYVFKTSISHPHDAELAYFKSRSGLVSTATKTYHINDHKMATLAALGYNQNTLQDRLVAFYGAKTGITTRNLKDLGYAFHKNTTNDFI
jgi:hypothetical protein